MNPFAREASKHGRSRSNAERATTKLWISKHLDGCIPHLYIVISIILLRQVMFSWMPPQGG